MRQEFSFSNLVYMSCEGEFLVLGFLNTVSGVWLESGFHKGQNCETLTRAVPSPWRKTRLFSSVKASKFCFHLFEEYFIKRKIT